MVRKRRGGYTQTLQYNASNRLTSVTDSYGHQMLFTLQNGLVSTITAPAFQSTNSKTLF